MSGADYFVNTGVSRQRGIEAAANWNIFLSQTAFLRRVQVWTNYTFQHFRYKDFKQLTNDFSGNTIPGTAPNALASGISVITAAGLYANISHYYTDHIYLNDANSAIAKSYQLAGFRGGYRTPLGSHILADIYISGDNIFNEEYSLGNDINAAANRYYNVATASNFQAGLRLSFN